MSTGIHWRVVTRYALVIVLAALAGAFIHSRLPAPPTKPLMSDSDVMFAQMMMTHHQQALTIADLLAPDAAPELRALANQITLAQQAEIGTMIGWLQLADQPLNPVATPAPHEHDMAGMSGMSAHHDTAPSMTMPGMASPADLARLHHARGPENEVLFLQLMLRHHQGGIDMAARQAHDSTTEAIRRTALSMADEQLQETALMQQLLAVRHAAPLPYP